MERTVKTEDGSNTLYSDRYKEHYHSTHGALNESQHIFINSGLNYSKLNYLKVFEVGFGTGLNAILTYRESLLKNLTVDYTAIELHPLSFEIVNHLNFKNFLRDEEFEKFREMHNATWNNKIKIDEKFTIHKLHADLTNFHFFEKYDLIYFDAFAPEKQPQIWTQRIFKAIYDACNLNAILTTYSSKGIVKRNLRNAGFKVIRLTGPKGKRHILRAEKI